MVWEPSQKPGLSRPAQCDTVSSETGTPSLMVEFGHPTSILSRLGSGRLPFFGFPFREPKWFPFSTNSSLIQREEKNLLF